MEEKVSLWIPVTEINKQIS